MIAPPAQKRKDRDSGKLSIANASHFADCSRKHQGSLKAQQLPSKPATYICGNECNDGALSPAVLC